MGASGKGGVVMGMFDKIRCEMPLPPDNVMSNTAFQTKDFEQPSMDQYVIMPDGTLFLEKMGNGGSRTGPAFYGGMLRFYHYAQSIKLLIEYVAHFTDGKCVKIERL